MKASFSRQKTTKGGENPLLPPTFFEARIQKLLRDMLQATSRSEPSPLGGLLMNTKPSSTQALLIKSLLPLLNVRVYYAPCVRLIMTAVEICRSIESEFVRATVRPDWRLHSTCSARHAGLQRMQQIAHRIRGGQGFNPEGYYSDCFDQLANIDLCWMESVLFQIEGQLDDSPQENIPPAFHVNHEDDSITSRNGQESVGVGETRKCRRSGGRRSPDGKKKKRKGRKGCDVLQPRVAKYQ